MNNSENKKTIEPIVFVNKPIDSHSNDIVGFSSQVEMICNAIEQEGATMIGIIADYGTGKSSMTQLIKQRFLKPDDPNPININM